MTLHLTPESALALALALHDPGYAVQAKRKAAADAIEDLIGFLDDTEGDCDLEALGDEQDASWPEQHMGRHRIAGTLSEDDEDGDPAEECDPPEAMLAAPECHCSSSQEFGPYRQYPRYEAVRYPGGNQTFWSQGTNAICRDDCEEVNEDGGDVLDAPHDGFLGWPEDVTVTFDTSTWFLTDAELDDSDSEDSDPAEDDGTHEYDLAFDFGRPRQTGDFDGPRDTEQKGQSDRWAASLMAAQAMRMARPRKVSA